MPLDIAELVSNSNAVLIPRPNVFFFSLNQHFYQCKFIISPFEIMHLQLMGIKMYLSVVVWIGVGVSVFSILPCSHGYTYEQDVYAINSLYSALGLPPLPGWSSSGGDPCMDQWQGVLCVNSNITSIVLSGANLGGKLGHNLVNFTSLINTDLSNNHIAGTIPEDLPVTLRQFFLSDNLLTGSIPASLSKLTLLSDMSLNNNNLTGGVPDAFQSLTGLINLDLSSNNLSGQLPPSMGNLFSLASLHIEDNHLSGTLDVLQDLPLQDLNIENNMFSGPIPSSLLNVPNFERDGNPLNTSIAPSPTVLTPLSSLPEAPAPQMAHPNFFHGPVDGRDPPPQNKKTPVLRIIGIVLASASMVVVAMLAFMLCISKLQEEQPKLMEKVPRSLAEFDKPTGSALSPSERKINILQTLMPLPPEKFVLSPMGTSDRIASSSIRKFHPLTSATYFSVATLQQSTSNFCKENLIQDGITCRVYLGELQQGKLLAILMIENLNSNPVAEFVELITIMSRIQHPHVPKFVGYCEEFGQRLLVYSFFSKNTLHDALHCEDDFMKKLSWNDRIHIALRAARALEYLHEGCQPPIVFRNFEPSNILVNDDLDVQISECGLASALSTSLTQFSDYGFSYQAPEVSEYGMHNEHSDTYSFGVVMLELLTGRKSYDNSLPRTEQHLVRWASSQLHDIDALKGMVDPSIQGLYLDKSLSRFADIISGCIQPIPEFRPSMSEVVQGLTRVMEGTMQVQSLTALKQPKT